MRNHLTCGAVVALCALQFLWGGCSSSTEGGFMECKLDIDENRQKVRKIGHYSYSYESYRECMRPLYLKRDLEEWKPLPTPANP